MIDAAIDRGLDRLTPISLDETNDLAALQTRVDRKYIVAAETLADLLDVLSAEIRVLDVGGERTCAYRSVYFDSADLVLYRAAVQGRRQRCKVRSRQYGEAGPCFLEIKTRGRRGRSVKDRMPYDPADRHVLTPEAHRFIEDRAPWLDTDALRPALISAYRRSTLVVPSDRSRVTFDRGLRCRTVEGDSATLDAVIVETKTSDVPSSADRWLWDHHIRPVKISKFGTGLAVLRPELPGNKWHRTIRRHWTEPSIVHRTSC